MMYKMSYIFYNFSFNLHDLYFIGGKILEKEYGFYKTLANENTFDFQKSPLKNWKIWNEYVNKLYEK